RHAEPNSGMLAAITRALEERDQTQGHGARVVAFAEPVAHRLGWEDARIALLRFGGLHHDIGKVVVRSTVLRRSGPLTLDQLAELFVDLWSEQADAVAS